MKHYIFLTTGGSTIDDAGNDVENCQQIADVVSAESALDAFNKIKDDKIYGCFDTCFCYELVNPIQRNDFAILDNHPAECVDTDCTECQLTKEQKLERDCPFMD